MECPVCYELIGKDIQQDLECGHLICKLCLARLIQRTCPLCRATISFPFLQNIIEIKDEEYDNYDNDIWWSDDFNRINDNIWGHDFDWEFEAEIQILRFNNQRRRQRRRQRPHIRLRNPTVEIRIVSNDEEPILLSEPNNSVPDTNEQRSRNIRNRWRQQNSRVFGPNRRGR